VQHIWQLCKCCVELAHIAKFPPLLHTLATKVVSLVLFVVDLESFAIGGAK